MACNSGCSEGCISSITKQVLINLELWRELQGRITAKLIQFQIKNPRINRPYYCVSNQGLGVSGPNKQIILGFIPHREKTRDYPYCADIPDNWFGYATSRIIEIPHSLVIRRYLRVVFTGDNALAIFVKPEAARKHQCKSHLN